MDDEYIDANNESMYSCNQNQTSIDVKENEVRNKPMEKILVNLKPTKRFFGIKKSPLNDFDCQKLPPRFDSYQLSSKRMDLNRLLISRKKINFKKKLLTFEEILELMENKDPWNNR